jgi:hypothetical protein
VQTISLTVMVLEGTGDMQYVLPLMLTVMAARWAGNLFTEGIYDMHIHAKRLRYLDEDESVTRMVQLHELTVRDIMTKRPFYMLPVMKVGDLYDIMKKAKHHCFPIGMFYWCIKILGDGVALFFVVAMGCWVDFNAVTLYVDVSVESDASNALVGTILRKTVCTLLQLKAFAPTEARQASRSNHTCKGNSFPAAAPRGQQQQQQQQQQQGNKEAEDDDAGVDSNNDYYAGETGEEFFPNSGTQGQEGEAGAEGRRDSNGNGDYDGDGDGDGDMPAPGVPLVAWARLESLYPQYPDLQDIQLSDSDRYQ